MEAVDKFPFDIFFDEILPKTSLETLGIARAISKATQNYTYSSYFMRLFHDNTKIQHGFFLQTIKQNYYYSTYVPCHQTGHILSLDFLPFPVMIEASSNILGLLFCKDKTSRACSIPPRYCICKPITKQWRLLPNPKTRYHTLSTAIVVLKSKPLWFKIIRLSKGNTWSKLLCEVFDSNNWAWKHLEDIKLNDFEFLNVNQHAIKASGSLHWLTCYDHYNVLAFDPNNEIWTSFRLPQEFYYKKDNEHNFPMTVRMCEYKGKLTVMLREDSTEWPVTTSTIHYWVMEDYRHKKWFKKESLKNLTWPLEFCDGDTTIMIGDGRLKFYTFTNETLRVEKIKHDKFILSSFEVFQIQSDTHPCDLLKGKH